MGIPGPGVCGATSLPTPGSTAVLRFKRHTSLEQSRVGVSAEERRGSLVPALLHNKLALGVT